MVRREFLAAALPLLLKRGCHHLENIQERLRGDRMIVWSFPPQPFSGIPYRVGNFLVTLGPPRIGVEAAPGGYAWFPGLHLFPNGNVLMRLNVQADTNLLDGSGRHFISTDGGQTFPFATSYAVAGSHTTNEPLLMGSDGVLRGGDYWRWTLDGTKRIGQCAYTTIGNGGLSYSQTPLGCTLTFPADINGNYGPDPLGGTRPGISWFGDIVRISDSQWLTVIPINYGLPLTTRVYGECMESNDQGVTWHWVGRACGEYADEGCSEPTTTRLFDGRLMTAFRCRNGRLGRTFSSDLGRTWTAPEDFNPHKKAPRILKLSNNNDYVLVTGYASAAQLGPYPLAPAQLGLYVTTDPTVLEWPVVDLIAHHNAMMPSAYAFDTINTSKGYASPLELSPGNILIAYDQSGAADGTGSTRLNRTFLVNANIKRVA